MKAETQKEGPCPFFYLLQAPLSSLLRIWFTGNQPPNIPLQATPALILPN